MTDLRAFFSVMIILFLVFVGGNAWAKEAVGSPHVNGGEGFCLDCHTPRPPELVYDHVDTCTNCHIGNIENHPVTRHPIDKEVTINTPSPLPLTKEKRLVCSTCHDPHDEHGFSSMLRVPYHQLCIQCHKGY
ncbi:MAG: cytochrome c3 family protein [Thermodesulfobacteriota bacterium]